MLQEQALRSATMAPMTRLERSEEVMKVLLADQMACKTYATLYTIGALCHGARPGDMHHSR